jgi:hypothetical protein
VSTAKTTARAGEIVITSPRTYRPLTTNPAQRSSLTPDVVAMLVAEALRQAINFALTDPDVKTPNGIAMATEIRAHLKGLPDKERFGFLQNAIKAGDLPTVSAALNAAPRGEVH